MKKGRLENSSSGGKFEQPARIQRAPISITVSKYFSESCHIYLIQYLGNSTKASTFGGFFFLLLLFQFFTDGGPFS